ncbi:MAG: hypothetical protein J0M37_15520 [Ignavibacteria bacterium]|nr:hypothetical protein [Ignavibacteria bacterium]
MKELKVYTGFVNYSDEAKKFKSYLPDLKYIIDKIKYKIPEIEPSIYLLIGTDGFFTVWFSYNFFQNHESVNDVIYYGGIELTIYRDFTDKKTEAPITVSVFHELYYVNLMNPTLEMIKTDSYSITNELIDKFALEYYRDN